MTNRYAILLVISSMMLGFSSCRESKESNKAQAVINPGIAKKPAIPCNPAKYICYRADSTIAIDGLLNEPSWLEASWSSDFTDIEGTLKPEPLYRTRVKMLWDDKYLYIGAELMEPDIWSYLRQRDTVIFYDNDFEVFIDPDGDTHEYCEFEMNASNTVWDLLLTKPYRDNGNVIDAWNIGGLKSAVTIYGTINNPADKDNKWIIELAFPLDVLSEIGSMPADSTVWRINFSRVNWQTTTEGKRYNKKVDPETGKPLPEYNWVWSPQGIINMHYPEMWGYLQFSSLLPGTVDVKYINDSDAGIKWNLRTLYYTQRVYATKFGHYCSNIEELGNYGYEQFSAVPEIYLTMSGYEASVISESTGLIWIINDEGRVFSTGKAISSSTGGPGEF